MNKYGYLLAAILSPAMTQAHIDPRCTVYVGEHRSQSVLHQFDKATGYPRGRKGYVRDHICPLACGGADAVYNLQWQTVAEGKRKDKMERSTLGYELFCTKPEGP